jgi:uncharacterized membrane protein
MTLNQKQAISLSKCLVLIGVLISAWAWPLVADDARIAIHFNLQGNADGFASKTLGLLLMPAIMLGFSTLFSFLPSLEPRKFNLEESRSSYLGVWFVLLLFLLYIHLSIVGLEIGLLDNALVGFPIVMSVLFFLLGRQIRSAKSNFFFGVRTPWTLSSDYAWRQANYQAGTLFMGLGILGAILGFLRGQSAITWIIYVAIAIAVYGVIISYVYWRFDTKKYDK